jgi:hypothetical protein
VGIGIRLRGVRGRFRWEGRKACGKSEAKGRLRLGSGKCEKDWNRMEKTYNTDCDNFSI